MTGTKYTECISLLEKNDSQYTEYNLHNLDTYFTTFWIVPIIIIFFPYRVIPYKVTLSD